MPTYTTEINQSSAFSILPAGQEIVMALSNELCVANEQNVKFCFDIYVKTEISYGGLIGTFKTTPNNEGVGMIDVSNLIQNYVSADNIASTQARFKDKEAGGKPIPIHIIDMFSRAENAVRRVLVEGYTEYTDSSGTLQQTSTISVASFITINGYVKHSNLLQWTSETYTGDAFGIGFNLEDFAIQSSSTKKFLTNSPSTLYARTGDYGTLSYISMQNLDQTTLHDDVEYIKITMYPEYDAGGTTLGNADLDRTEANGAYDGTSSWYYPNRILYFGAFPSNIRAWSDDFNTALSGNMKSYTIGAYDDSDDLISELKTVNILCPNLKGFEQVRLTWLNQWGTWDYFTFNQKSVKTIATKGTTYQQLGGTWNGEVNDTFGYKGGKKSFRVNGTEKIKMNTDYLTEEHSEWFEELINSPEIYILKYWESPRQRDSYYVSGAIIKSMNQYATPCTLKTTSFTKKTVANDKLIQYTFEVEKARNLRTQSI